MPVLQNKATLGWGERGRRRRIAMKSDEFRGFAELYRAAYAEADQEKKSILLREVRKAIERRIREPSDELSSRAEAA
jgi:hypothetical protein